MALVAEEGTSMSERSSLGVVSLLVGLLACGGGAASSAPAASEPAAGEPSPAPAAPGETEAASAPAASDAASSESVSAATSAAESWLKLVDDAQYDASLGGRDGDADARPGRHVAGGGLLHQIAAGPLAMGV
jgi:hypothetical protein